MAIRETMLQAEGAAGWKRHRLIAGESMACADAIVGLVPKGLALHSSSSSSASSSALARLEARMERGVEIDAKLAEGLLPAGEVEALEPEEEEVVESEAALLLRLRGAAVLT